MIDESADDRVAAGGVVAVNGDGQNEARHFARGDTWGITVVSLHNVPPEVAAFRDDVHFLPAILPNVTGEEEPGGAVERKAPDRKSTRLNSSHLVISYAVFCLKKKKKIKRQ